MANISSHPPPGPLRQLHRGFDQIRAAGEMGRISSANHDAFIRRMDAQRAESHAGSGSYRGDNGGASFDRHTDDFDQPPMQENKGMAQSTIAYLCECGKKWIFPRKEGQGPSKVKCSCGRTILLRDGVVYSTAK